jgi:DNA-binding NarL/FixJ family response regulator
VFLVMQGRATLIDSPIEAAAANGERTAVALAAEHTATARRLRAIMRADGFDVTVAVAELRDLSEAPAVVVIGCDAAALERGSDLGQALAEMPMALPIVVSPAAGRHCVRKALALGAVGYVTDADAQTTLAPTIRAVIAGQVCVPQAMHRQLDRPAFSYREKQVLELVARGMTNSQIAQRLFLAESTVKTHLSTGFRKLGVRSRKDAAAIVLDPDLRIGYGLFTVPDDEDVAERALPALLEEF